MSSQNQVNLTEMWRASDKDLSRRPTMWLRHSGQSFRSQCESRRGRKGGTWSTEEVGEAYAKFLVKSIRRSKGKVSVYFLQCQVTGLIKIGMTRGFASRMPVYRTHCPTPLKLIAILEVGKTYAERLIHDRFAEHRQHGEWFSPSSPILSLVAAINEAPV